jgi:hypothetical protein
MAYDPNDPFAAEEKFDESDAYEQADADLTDLNDEAFFDRYKSSKQSYKALVGAIKHLEEAREAIQELVDLNIDSELLENTELLITDYKSLLEQMHMASYWEQEK